MTASTFTHCSVSAKQLDPETIVGSAWGRKRILLLEVPLPWAHNTLESTHVTPDVKAAVQHFTSTIPGSDILAIAPDTSYPAQGSRLIDILVTNNKPISTEIACDPHDLAKTIIARANSEALPESATATSNQVRDIVVCTHGTRDACCATFGFPLYRQLKSLSDGNQSVRIWRSSHFNGHRYAPTLIDFENGRSWGFVDEFAADAIYHRSSSPSQLAGYFRGWIGHQNPEAQMIEGEAFAREGWQWEEYEQTFRVIDRDSENRATRIELIGKHPNDRQVSYRGSIEWGEPYSALGSCSLPPVTLQRRTLTDVSFEESSVESSTQR